MMDSVCGHRVAMICYHDMRVLGLGSSILTIRLLNYCSSLYNYASRHRLAVFWIDICF